MRLKPQQAQVHECWRKKKGELVNGGACWNTIKNQLLPDVMCSMLPAKSWLGAPSISWVLKHQGAALSQMLFAFDECYSVKCIKPSKSELY